MTDSTRLIVRSATDVGLRRQQNEDSHGSWVPEDPAERKRRGVLLVVADGMGGSLAGEVASRLAVQTALSSYRESTDALPHDALYRAIAAANRVVHDESTRDPQLSGMGTTCTALAVIGRDIAIAHVGDSRAYLFRNGRAHPLTHDHSLVAQMVREGQLTAEQAKSDPRRNVVTRSVGVGAEVDIDAEYLDHALEPGDTLLLCSDGLHGLMSDDELAGIASEPDLQHACRDAIALANQRGGPDNITVMMARLEAAGVGAESTTPGVARRDPDTTQGGGAAPVHPDAETTMVYMPAAKRADVPPPADPPRGNGTSDARRAPEYESADEAMPELDVSALTSSATRRRPSSAMLLVWLIAALAVLLLSVAAIALVWKRLDDNRSNLEGQSAETAETR